MRVVLEIESKTHSIPISSNYEPPKASIIIPYHLCTFQEEEKPPATCGEMFLFQSYKWMSNIRQRCLMYLIVWYSISKWSIDNKRSIPFYISYKKCEFSWFFHYEIINMSTFKGSHSNPSTYLELFWKTIIPFPSKHIWYSFSFTLQLDI